MVPHLIATAEGTQCHIPNEPVQPLCVNVTLQASYEVIAIKKAKIQ